MKETALGLINVTGYMLHLFSLLRKRMYQIISAVPSTSGSSSRKQRLKLLHFAHVGITTLRNVGEYLLSKAA